MKKILIMGLPGSGKTTLASKLVPLLNAKRLNNDEVRKAANDWDFSEEARTRQAKRMADFAEKYKQEGHYVVADFICPTPKARELFNADYVVWIDTIKKDQEIKEETEKKLHNIIESFLNSYSKEQLIIEDKKEEKIETEQKEKKIRLRFFYAKLKTFKK